MKRKTRESALICVFTVGFVTNLFLGFVKLYVGQSSNSLSVFSDAIHNFFDAVSFAIVIFCFFIMSKNAGGEAPFGYGRIEYMAGFISAVMILAAGVLFLYSAIERLLYPFLLLFSWLNFGIIAFGALIKVFLGLFFFGRNKKLDSIVLKGSGIDSFMDAGITLMTLVGYLTAGYIAPRADAFVGMIISIIIIVEGIKLIKNNAKALLGKNLDEKTKRSILKIAEKHGILADEGAITLHDYGKNRKIVIFDALIDSKDMSGLQEFKDAAESFTREASEKFDMEFKVCILPK